MEVNGVRTVVVGADLIKAVNNCMNVGGVMGPTNKEIAEAMFSEGSVDAHGYSLLQGSQLATACLQAARIENTVPFSYRLKRLKETGELVLQGCFQWQEGWKSGHEWRDIPTTEEE
jgi:hypothetical protein